ncbi:hypothetical protein BDF14DRAFT_1773607 [Spinellus fusiger]|nr:hypothetical protein BDF14DRAFT_1773607 [Spinellus fusiger]
MQIRNKTILVYGGTSGIGKEVVRLLITKGGLVGFTGTNVEKGNALVKQIREEWSPSEAFPEPPRVLFYPSDITDWTLQKKVYEAIEEEFGQSVDIVIVIAGMVDSSNIIDDTEQDGIYKTIQVNLTAAAKANRIAIQHFFREKKPGCVINTSSIFGFCAAPLAPLYAATKHGVSS